MPFAGGILVTDGDVVLGAVGASGAHAREDEQAVLAAVAQWRAQRPR
ncbi:heme-binding protein [Amycolatopsis sp. OK19-0408]|uniref:Heme-binding protein n=1 Tax=Amycolatopsis iheyensis TaxID=2945988 RepID=A0A9X2SPM3_9PSEU|nr:heme-binding protein [Amycolatopsis iheyensis]MCR6487705.1 heme-binding protein [Amycolatopsis iheyensis]